MQPPRLQAAGDWHAGTATCFAICVAGGHSVCTEAGGCPQCRWRTV